jgi:hypothetical protein
MKKICLLLLISTTAVFAADPALQLFTSARTNSETVCRVDTYTRNGETNLVRTSLARNGNVESRHHKFYQGGVLVGEHWNDLDSSGFITEANLPYSMIFKSSPSNNTCFAYICSEDRIVIDSFASTNGLFVPVDTSSLQAARRMTTEMQKASSPAPQ